MQIQKDAIVGIHYKLTDSSGELIDSSEGMEPLIFLFGSGEIIVGLEEELLGKSVGDKFTAIISPEKAYGERDDQMLQTIPREQFDDAGEVSVGMQFEVETELGALIVTVRSFDDKTVTIDGNHALAGMTLHFDVEVTEVRAATPEELEHNHAH